MNRLLTAAALPVLLALAAGCGAASGPAATNAQGSPASPGVSTGHLVPATPSPTFPARVTWLPLLTASQVAADGLLPRNWTLVRVTQGGTVAEISYSFGGCMPQPKGVLMSQSATAVTLWLEGPRPKVAAMCAPVLALGTARVRIPALAGRTLRHPPAAG